MVYVMFEVKIRDGQMDSYLDMATSLKEELAGAPGFIRAERFSSLVTEGKLLSLSVWEDEAAVSAWRNRQAHRAAQRGGRESIFDSYRITVAEPLRSYTDNERQQAPEDSNQLLHT